MLNIILFIFLPTLWNIDTLKDVGNFIGMTNTQVVEKKLTPEMEIGLYPEQPSERVNSDNFVCPEDEESIETYTKTMIEQAREYEKINPSSSDEDFANYRYSELVAHDCQKTIDDIQSHKPEESPYREVIK